MIPKADRKFLEDFAMALEPINIKAGEKCNLWMNDEVIQSFTTDIGSFELSIDIWDLVFVMSKTNQSVIIEIDKLLQSHHLFEKEEVNFSEYVLKENNTTFTPKNGSGVETTEVKKTWWKFWGRL